MQMPSVDILMFEDNVGLLSVAHFLHVFICNLPELFIGQLIFGRWVQRYMEYRITRAPIGFEVRYKISMQASTSIRPYLSKGSSICCQ